MRAFSRAVSLGMVLLCAFCAPVSALPPAPRYDWDFTPAQFYVNGSQSFDAFVTIRNLPTSPVNLLGTDWYALDLFPGAAADVPGPYRIQLPDLAVLSMNLAPGQSFTAKFARFSPRNPVSVGYDELLIAGAYMRFLGPSGEFLDVGGLQKQLRVTVIPEPSTVLLAIGAMLASLSTVRRYR